MFPLAKIKKLQIYATLTSLVIGMLIYISYPFPLGSWIPVSILLVSVPLYRSFDNKECYTRYTGLLLGLVFSVLIWLAIEFDYGLVFIGAPFYFAIRNRVFAHSILIYTILATTDMSFMIEFTTYNRPDFFEFSVDRFFSALIGISICILVHYVFFRKKVHDDIPKAMITSLDLAMEELDVIKDSQASSFVKSQKLNERFNQELSELRIFYGHNKELFTVELAKTIEAQLAKCDAFRLAFLARCYKDTRHLDLGIM